MENCEDGNQDSMRQEQMTELEEELINIMFSPDDIASDLKKDFLQIEQKVV